MKIFLSSLFLAAASFCGLNLRAQCDTNFSPTNPDKLWEFADHACAVAGQPYNAYATAGVNTTALYQDITTYICKVKIDSTTWNGPNPLTLGIYHNSVEYGYGQWIDVNAAQGNDHLCFEVSTTTNQAGTNYLKFYGVIQLSATPACTTTLAQVPFSVPNNVDSLVIETVTDPLACPTVQNEIITGNVVYTDPVTSDIDTATCGTVYFYTVTPIFTLADSAILSGTAPFAWLPAGNGPYTARYVPCDTTLLPTYFPDALSWEEAQTLTVGAGNPNIIHAFVIPELQGPGEIEGYVFEGGKSDKALGVPDVPVFLKNTSEQILRYTQTDAGGKYRFGNLPYGTYLVQPEIPGVNATPYTVEVTEDSASSVDFVYSGNEIAPLISTVSITEFNAASGLSISPNPAGGEVSVRFYAAKSQQIQMQVTDMNGRPVFRRNVTATEGNNTLAADLTAIPAGIYTLRIQGATLAGFQKLVITR